MLPKIVSGWFFGISLGTGGVILLGEYLKHNGIGIRCKDQRPKYLEYPRSNLDWERAFDKSKQSKSIESGSQSLKDFKDSYLKTTTDNIQSKLILTNFLFPLANPDLNNFEKIITLPVSQTVLSNLVITFISLPVFFHKKFLNYFWKYLGFLGIYGGFLGIIIETAKMLSLNQIRNIHNDEKPSIWPVSYTLHQFSLISLFTISMYAGFSIYDKFPNSLMQYVEKPEVVRQIARKHYGILTVFLFSHLLGNYLDSLHSKGLTTAAQEEFTYFTRFLDYKDAKYPEKGTFFSENTISKTRLAAWVLNYILFINILDNQLIENRKFLILRNAKRMFFLFNLNALSELIRYYKETSTPLPHLLTLLFLSVSIYGVVGLAKLRPLIMK